MIPDREPCDCDICRTLRKHYRENPVTLIGEPRRGKDHEERIEFLRGAMQMLKDCAVTRDLRVRAAVLWGLKNDRVDPIWKRLNKAAAQDPPNWEYLEVWGRKFVGG